MGHNSFSNAISSAAHSVADAATSAYHVVSDNAGAIA